MKRVQSNARCAVDLRLQKKGLRFGQGVWLIVILALGSGARAQEFRRHRVGIEGEIRAVRAEDLDGDGWKEMLVTFTVHLGHAPERYLHVYGWSGNSGEESLSLHNAWRVIPEAVFWDVGPAMEAAGKNHCYFLSPEGLFELCGDGEAGLVAVLRIEAPVFVSVGQEDEFTWLDTLRDWDGDGSVEALLPLGRETRFYRQEKGTGWKLADSVKLKPFAYYNNNTLFGRKVGSHQYLAVLFYPLLEPADLDGDGRTDLLALQNGKGFCYSRGENGKLDAEPVLWDLEIRSEEEKIRRKATLSYRVVDLNQDGCADVVVHKVGARLMQWNAETVIFLGRPDGERPKRPDHRFASRGLLSGVSVEDLDGDGYADITMWSVKMGLWSMVDILLRRVIHVESEYYYGDWPKGFSTEATGHRGFDFRIDPTRQDFFLGVVPNTEGDFNEDGLKDLVAGKGGEELAIYPGLPGRDFSSRPWCTLEASGINYVRAEDLNGNGGCDIYGYQVEDKNSILHVWLQDQLAGRNQVASKQAP